jgi:hypothetical protein
MRLQIPFCLRDKSVCIYNYFKPAYIKQNHNRSNARFAILRNEVINIVYWLGSFATSLVNKWRFVYHLAAKLPSQQKCFIYAGQNSQEIRF